MNEHDPFEQRLRWQTMRQVPSAWREEILAAAEAARPKLVTRPASEDQAAWIVGWRLLLGRLPLAWASLAAVWALVIGVNLALCKPAGELVSRATASIGPADMAVLAALTAELDSAPAPFPDAPRPSPTDKPSALPQRPRSEYRRGLDFGVATASFEFGRVA